MLSYIRSIDINWTNITGGYVEWATQGYVIALGFLFWPLVFTGVIGYVYLKQQSLVAAVAVILIIFAVFSNALVLAVQPWINILYVGVSVICAALFVYLYKKYKG
jgi:hypothetical protein